MFALTAPRLARLALAMAAILLPVASASAGSKVYVGNFADSTVSVIDAATGKVVATVPVATGPHGMAVTQDGRTVFVTGDGSSSMSVIDTASDKVVKTVDVGKTPNGIALTPDGKQLLVAINGEDRLAFLDAASQTQLGSVSVAKPHTVAISPDGRIAYVTSQAPSSPALDVIDIPTETVIDSIKLDKIPRDGEFKDDGKAFYFTEAGVNAVQVLDLATGKIAAQIPTGASPHFVKVFPWAKLGMVVVQGPGEVLFFDPATSQPVKTVAVGKQPHWLALAGDTKTAYVTNEGDGTVSAIDLASGTTNTIPVGKAPRKVVVQQSASPTAAAAATVSITNFAFGPASLTVHVGDSVTFTNNDGATHSVTFKDGSAGADSLSPGQSFTRTFDHAGTFDYFCSFHPYMTGTIVVAP